jgi:RimJ/RimL family protein N-acetyltransferase
MIYIRPYDPKDAEAICPNAIDDSLCNDEDYWRAWARANAVCGPAYTGLIGDEIVGVAGIRNTGDDRAWVWAAFSPRIQKCKKDACRSMKIFLKTMMEEFQIKEVWAESRKGFRASQRLLEHLGFENAGHETDTHYHYMLRAG